MSQQLLCLGKGSGGTGMIHRHRNTVIIFFKNSPKTVHSCICSQLHKSQSQMKGVPANEE